MNTRYVPPHLRKRSNATDGESCSLQEAAAENDGLRRRRLSELSLSKDDSKPHYSILELQNHYNDNSSTKWGTLHNSGARNDELAYVLLLKRANPRWEDDNIIFAHSNINLLPGYTAFHYQSVLSEIDHTIREQLSTLEISPNTVAETAGGKTEASTTLPREPGDHYIPIFKEVILPNKNIRRIVFEGYFELEKVDFLKPRSPELVRMLEQKWGSGGEKPLKANKKRKERGFAAWQQSFNQEWAVIKFGMVERGKWPEEPNIGQLPDEAHDCSSWRADVRDDAFEEQSGENVDTVSEEEEEEEEEEEKK